ncbi:MAG: hypothetical protein AB7G37_02775 [Solirubrobacteraceae bacterium]
MDITVTDRTGTIVEDATVPGDRASGAIAARLAVLLELPGTEEGAATTRYVFRHERTGRIVPDGMALVSAGVVDGDTLKLVALGGAPSPAAAAPSSLDEPTLANVPVVDEQETVAVPRPAPAGSPATALRPGRPPAATGAAAAGTGGASADGAGPGGRKPPWALIAGVVVLLLVAGGIGYLVSSGGDDDPGPRAGGTTDVRPSDGTTTGSVDGDRGTDGGDQAGTDQRTDTSDPGDRGDTTSVPTVRGDTPADDGQDDETPADGGPPDDEATQRLASAMDLSAEGRRLSVAGDLSGAKLNRIEVLSAIDAIETANGVDQIRAVDELRKAIRASIAAIEEREAGLTQTAYDEQATAAKQRYCRLWESSGMASSTGKTCDPDAI